MDAQPPVDALATRRFNASPERVFDAWLDPESVRSRLEAARENTTLGSIVHLDGIADMLGEDGGHVERARHATRVGRGERSVSPQAREQ